MSPREAELEETVRQLRQQLHVEPERVKVDKIQVALKVGRYPALLMAALHDAGSTWLDAERLGMALPDSADRGVAVLRVHICRLRQALGPDAILHMRDVGYTLGAPGVLACKRALATNERVDGLA